LPTSIRVADGKLKIESQVRRDCRDLFQGRFSK
jgi:hypothetical protein